MLKLNIQMFADVGTLTIKTELETTKFEKDVDELVDIAEKKGEESGSAFGNLFSKASNKIKTTLSSAFSKVTGLGKGLLKVIGGIGSSIAKIGLGLGVAGVLIGALVTGATIVGNAFKKLTEENESFKANIQYIVWAIGKALEPAVNAVAGVLVQIVNIIVKAIQYVAVLIKMLTGHNIFGNASAKDFASSMAEAEAKSKKTGKNLKEMKKQLAGFDEMNVLQDTTDTGGAGGGGIDIGTPSIDLSNLDLAEAEVEKFIKDWKTFGEEMKTTLDNTTLEDWFNAFGKWGLAVNGVTQMAYGLWEIIQGLVDFILGIVDIVVGLITGDTEKVEQGVIKMLDGLWEIIDGLINAIIGILKTLVGLIIAGLITLLENIWNLLVGVGKWVYDNVLLPIFNFLVSVGAWIVETVQNIIAGAYELLVKVGDWVYKHVIKPVADFFVGLWNGLKTGFKNAVDWIKNTFNNVVNFFSGIVNKIMGFFRSIGTNVGNAIGGAFKGVINGVLGAIESILNFPIRAINRLINTINKIPGINLGTLSTFSLPRLAKGGIVSMPGRGVPVGSAIAGERGQEGVIPLTDSQQMELLGQSIGKYITINANITNTMNGRVISKELQKIQAENDFAFNK